MKLIRREPESDALVDWLHARATSTPVTSVLATAHAVFGGRLASFVSYDKRLLGAAEALGLPVASPGA